MVERRELKSAWGDLRRGVWMAITRAGLLRIGSDMEPKSWRPNPLLFSGSPTRRWHLIDFANALTHDRGILSIASVLTEETISAERRRNLERSKREYLRDRGVQALVRIITAPDFYEGAIRIVGAYGLGPLVPNTIILGAAEREEIEQQYCDLIRNLYEQHRNVLVVHDRKDGKEPFAEQRQIHIWWGGLKGNGGLMLILAYLLQSSLEWRNADVHLKMIIDDETAVDEVHRNLEELTDTIRIGAVVDVLVSRGRPFNQILHESSAEADLILMGMAPPETDFRSYYGSKREQIKDLPTTVLVLAAQDISFGEVLIQKDRMG